MTNDENCLLRRKKNKNVAFRRLRIKIGLGK